MTRRNVREQIILTDSILVSKWVAQMPDRPQGWFSTFNDAGRAGEWSFMNVRNRSIGIAYNNQDARDQLPFGMRIMSLGVKFWGPAAASNFTACTGKGSTASPGARVPWDDQATTTPAYADLTNREELHSGVWEADLPNHVSLILRTNQDIRLRGPVALFAPGYGAVGGGWGWGSPGDLQINGVGGTPAPAISRESSGPNFGSYAANLETVQHGDMDLRQRFPFPVPIEVPKRANLSVTLHLSQYARELLSAMTGPYWIPMADEYVTTAPQVIGLTKSVKAVAFGVAITIQGERLVQQRGDYAV